MNVLSPLVIPALNFCEVKASTALSLFLGQLPRWAARNRTLLHYLGVAILRLGGFLCPFGPLTPRPTSCSGVVALTLTPRSGVRVST